MRKLLAGLAALASLWLPAAAAQVLSVQVDGSDAIFLAGRTDVTIPPASMSWDVLARHPLPTPEEIQETLPPFISVAAGDVIRVADPAIGSIDFFNGFTNRFGPGGNTAGTSTLNGLGAISGYRGPQGPLAGVFLDDAVPSNSALRPATIDFLLPGATNFTTLSPLLRQVFYIGDGLTSGGVLQQFVAPAGATRLFFAIPDGFGFVGPPGAYDDNDGFYRISVGINAIPVIPEPQTYALLLAGLGLLGFAMRRRARVA